MSAIMAHGLSTPPVEDSKSLAQPTRRASAKNLKAIPRGSKRASSALSVEHHSPVVMDGRHKRVWKACERCRMKKTKCDGESPCKRCKDDGLVCTAGSRKKTEFKQLPRGYAEVLENTQYALIATVQKLYSMVRNGEKWELGEPELNDRGLPVIHNIAEKLGCIRPSPDLPCAFPEDAEEFAELQAQLEAAEKDGSDQIRRKLSHDSAFSAQSRSLRASSSESDHSHLSKDYNQMVWAQQQQQQHQQQQQQQQQQQRPQHPSHHGLPTAHMQQTPIFHEPQFRGAGMPPQSLKQEPQPSMHDLTAFDQRPIASPAYSDFQAAAAAAAANNNAGGSPIFRTASPFSPWSAGGDEFLAPGHLLDMTALYMRQSQSQNQRSSFSHGGIPRSNHPSMEQLELEAGLQRSMRLGDAGLVNPAAFASNASAVSYLNGSDGTIRPNMLDCSTGYDLADQMDSIMFSDYEAQGGGMRMS